MKKQIVIILLLFFFIPFLPVFSIPNGIFPFFGFEEFSSNMPTNVDFSLFWKAWNVVRIYHLSRDKLDSQKMIMGAVNGMLQSLDPFTRYIEPADVIKENQQIQGNFTGIGITMSEDEDGVKIDSVLRKSPAERAGLLIGDVVTKINNKEIAGQTISQVADLFKGEAGTTVSISIERSGKELPLLEITRKTFELETVYWKGYNIRETRIAVITITQFYANTAYDFCNISLEVLVWKPDAILIDLRDNPGGLLLSVLDLCSQIIGPNKIVFYEQNDETHRIAVNSYHSSMRFGDKPIALLVNRHSASAAEIMAACLKDNMKVMIYGTKTYGKGCAQRPIEIGDNQGTCMITFEKWLRPNGKCIWGNGIDPDVKVKKEKDDLSGEKQLMKTLSLFASEVKKQKFWSEYIK